MSGQGTEVAFAAERLWPPLGGAEESAVEMAGALAAIGYRVRCIGLERQAAGNRPLDPAVEWQGVPQPDHDFPFWDWRARVARSDAVGAAVLRSHRERPIDLIVTYDTAAPGVARAARAAGRPLVLWIPGYESLCHWRFGVGSRCVPPFGCRTCPRTLELAGEERVARIAHGAGHAAALAGACDLITVSAVMADAVEEACGRRPRVIAPMIGPPPRVRADPAGHVLAISSIWTRDKGAGMLAPIARRLGGRRLVVQNGRGRDIVALPGELLEQGNVEVLDSSGPIAEALEGASLLIVPSQLPDPWVRVAFEGMAAGVPVVVSDTGGMREYVPIEQRVHPHDDPDAWGAMMARTLSPERWAIARDRGFTAASGVLAGRPVERFAEAVDAAARPQAIDIA
jgi:glycosyltransferase involved in cell wall biosynthesis